MGVDGTIVTSLKTDNRASPLTCVVVWDGRACGARCAIVDIDGLLLNRNISGLSVILNS